MRVCLEVVTVRASGHRERSLNLCFRGRCEQRFCRAQKGWDERQKGCHPFWDSAIGS